MIRYILASYYDITGNKNFIKALIQFYLSNDFKVICFIRRILHTKNKLFKIIYINKLEKKYSVKIGNNVRIGTKMSICHHFGIVLGDDVVIGNNCKIFNHVTIGQKNGKYPVIGDNVIMYPGCKLIGDICIGNNAIIAPNSVVINNVEENAMVSGIPAKFIGWRKD